MTYTKDTPLSGAGRGNADHIINWAILKGCARPDDVRDFVTTVYKIAPQIGLNPDCVVAQSIHETTDKGIPWNSAWWRNRCNPAGIGITGDAKQNAESRDFLTGGAAAMGVMLHLSLYVNGDTVPPAFLESDDPRWQAAIDAGYAGIADTLDDLNGRWAIDPQNNYGGKIARVLNEMESAGLLPGPTQEEPPMVRDAKYWTEIPGLPGGKLGTAMPVKIKLIPARLTRNRPGIKAQTPRYSIQHGNGNGDSTAAGEASYFSGGAGGRQASVHAACDDLEAWIILPFDEVGWQSTDGAGPGNMNGYACEMVEDDDIWASTSRALACIENNAELMGRAAARLGAKKPQQHWDFNYVVGPSARHDCPYKLRHRTINNRKAWDIYDGLWYAYRADELVRMGRPSIPAPDPVPAYAKPIEIAELVDLMKQPSRWDSAPVVVERTKEGDRFFPVFDVVEATKDTKRLQYAAANSPEIGPPLKKGERFVVAVLFVAGDGQLWYITPGVYDQAGKLLWGWTRVKAADTVRISDAPIVQTEDTAKAA